MLILITKQRGTETKTGKGAQSLLHTCKESVWLWAKFHKHTPIPSSNGAATRRGKYGCGEYFPTVCRVFPHPLLRLSSRGSPATWLLGLSPCRTTDGVVSVTEMPRLSVPRLGVETQVWAGPALPRAVQRTCSGLCLGQQHDIFSLSPFSSSFPVSLSKFPLYIRMQVPLDQDPP